MTTRRGFTAIELAMVVVVAAIVIAVSLPTGDASAKQEGILAGQNFETDVSFARSKSIAEPDDPVVIKVDIATNKYWLAKSSAPATPIAHPSTGLPYVVQFGVGGKKGFEHVQIVAQDFNGSDTLTFDGTGSLSQTSTAILQLSSSNAEYEVNVSPAAARTTVKSGFTVDLGENLGGGQLIVQ